MPGTEKSGTMLARRGEREAIAFGRWVASPNNSNPQRVTTNSCTPMHLCGLIGVQIGYSRWDTVELGRESSRQTHERAMHIKIW